MIRIGTGKDTKWIYTLWKDLFSFDDGGYSDYFFQVLYDPRDVLVLEENGEFVACLQRRKHQVMVNGKPFDTSIIVGVMCKPEHQRKGYMTKLMHACLEEAKQEELLTFIQAYNMRLYEPFGFRPVKGKKQVHYPQTQSKLELQEMISYQTMKQCFQHAMKEKSGYFVRDDAYFKRFLDEVHAQDGHIYTINDVSAYAVVYQSEKGIICEELMARDEADKLKMIEALGQLGDFILIDQLKSNEVDDFDNTLILFHDIEKLSSESGVSVSDLNNFETNGSKWFLPEFA